MNHGQVVIGPEFFLKEIENYSRWDFAWGREVGQNSLDADAKHIAIAITIGDEIGTCKVTWADDGCGMSLSILIDKFLTLGASHKKDGATGGFGWAKTLILFAQNSYRILTNDIVLEGCGGSYTYTQGNNQVNGTIIEVVIPKSKRTISTWIKSWAEWTDTKGASIILDGEQLPTFKNKTIKGEKELPVDWATMKVVKVDEGDASMYVRINGQMMSTDHVPDMVKDSLVIDIVGDSTDYFTANRDSLKWGPKNELKKFIKDLFRDPRKAVRIEKPKRITMVGRKGFINFEKKEDDMAGRLDFFLNNPEALAAALEEMKSKPKPTHDGYNMFLINETNKTVPLKWLPGMMSDYAAALMNRWCCIIQLVGEVIGHRRDILPGWIFSIDRIAQWSGSDSAMTLNPVHVEKMTGKMTQRYKMNNEDFAKLVVSAIHEFTHAAGHDYHDEDFVNAENRATEQVLHAWAKFKTLRRLV